MQALNLVKTAHDGNNTKTNMSTSSTAGDADVVDEGEDVDMKDVEYRESDDDGDDVMMDDDEEEEEEDIDEDMGSLKSFIASDDEEEVSDEEPPRKSALKAVSSALLCCRSDKVETDTPYDES